MEIKKLNFSKCKYVYDIHQELKHSLNFPDFYGENWDALWDCLWEYYDKPVFIKIEGFNSLGENLTNTKKMMLEVFDDVVKELNGFSYKITS